MSVSTIMKLDAESYCEKKNLYYNLEKYKRFFEKKNIVVVWLFRTGLYTFSSSEYKTSTLPKINKAYRPNAHLLYIVMPYNGSII